MLCWQKNEETWDVGGEVKITPAFSKCQRPLLPSVVASFVNADEKAKRAPQTLRKAHLGPSLDIIGYSSIILNISPWKYFSI